MGTRDLRERVLQRVERPARGDAVLVSRSISVRTIQLLFPFSPFSPLPAVAWSALPNTASQSERDP
jgi:hypothetical protein